MIRDVARVIAEALDASEEDVNELYEYVKERICNQIRRNIEQLQQSRHWPLLKPLLRRVLLDILEECGVRL